MEEIQLVKEDNGRGAFIIEQAGERVGEMVFSIDKDRMTVFHTQVSEKLKGQGAGTKLLNAMVDHARAHHLKVIPLCPFVSAQFKRHEEQYADIWEKSWH